MTAEQAVICACKRNVCVQHRDRTRIRFIGQKCRDYFGTTQQPIVICCSRLTSRHIRSNRNGVSIRCRIRRGRETLQILAGGARKRVQSYPLWRTASLRVLARISRVWELAQRKHWGVVWGPFPNPDCLCRAVAESQSAETRYDSSPLCVAVMKRLRVELQARRVASPSSACMGKDDAPACCDMRRRQPARALHTPNHDASWHISRAALRE